MKAVFLDRGSFPATIEFKLPDGIKNFVEYHNSTADQVIERIQDADIVLTNKAVVDAQAIAKATQLKMIQVMATGMNNVDLDVCQQHNIPVQNVSGYSTTSVPEHTFALLLTLRRNLVSYLHDIKSEKWAASEFFCFRDYPIKDLAGSTMTIIGRGTLGQKVAAIALAFGMKVIFAEHKGAESIRSGYVDFEHAIKQADVISINCPLTDQTKDLINDDEFALMKPTCLLLNISRGGIVNEKALVTAIKQSIIAGAAFDVATIEPMPKDHPLQELTQYPNFLLTPHIAWASDEAMQTLVDMAMDKISDFIDSLS